MNNEVSNQMNATLYCFTRSLTLFSACVAVAHVLRIHMHTLFSRHQFSLPSPLPLLSPHKVIHPFPFLSPYRWLLFLNRVSALFSQTNFVICHVYNCVFASVFTHLNCKLMQTSSSNVILLAILQTFALFSASFTYPYRASTEYWSLQTGVRHYGFSKTWKHPIVWPCLHRKRTASTRQTTYSHPWCVLVRGPWWRKQQNCM